MSFEYVRNRRDLNKTVSKVFPAAGANNNTPTIDLEQTIGGQIEEIAFEIAFPTLGNLADAHAITAKLQDSADNVTFTDVDPLTQTTVTGGGGIGSAAKAIRFRLPPATRRYVQLNVAVAASGGDSTASSITFSALF